MLKREPSNLQTYNAVDEALSATAIQELKRTQLSLWEADRAYWRNTRPEYANLAEGLVLTPVVDDRLVSATTDGKRIFFDARYSAGLKATTRRFLQAHLLWHCTLGHFLPQEKKDTHRWHLACDHEVNCHLFDHGFVLPSTSVLFFAKLYRPTEEVYTWLARHPFLDDEYTLDRLVQECNEPTLCIYDADFAPAQVNDALAEEWRSRARCVMRDTYSVSHLPDSAAFAC